jgi:hypothetical protein
VLLLAKAEQHGMHSISSCGLVCRPAEVVVPLGEDDDEELGEAAAERASGSAAGVPPPRGCLLHPSDERAVQWLTFLMRRGGKDAALFLRKWLREALRKEGMRTKGRSKAGLAPRHHELFPARLPNRWRLGSTRIQTGSGFVEPSPACRASILPWGASN